MGVVASVIRQSFPPESKFNVQDIPDLSGKVIIVTGANTGIGKETAKTLLAHNAKVYIAVRSEEKAKSAIDELKEQTGKEAIFLKLDLADLQSIKTATEDFMSKEKELHVLFNNAGVMAPPVEQVTAQGYDLQFGTNVLGHFYFTKLLLPTLLAAAKTSPDGKARILNTSSIGHCFASGLDFNTFKDGPARTKKGTQMLYTQSKLGNVHISNEFAKRYGEQGIVSTSFNPGNIKSDLQRHISPFEYFMIAALLQPLPYGALTQLWAGTSPEGAELNGKYLIPWARVGEATSIANDPKLSGELWTWLEEQVKDI
ncbi:NAD(P)-binding protein [Phlegmacium glaucopus]|nr:NAD(P)-binding protein [Phlegmacium glaucopus]